MIYAIAHIFFIDIVILMAVATEFESPTLFLSRSCYWETDSLVDARTRVIQILPYLEEKSSELNVRRIAYSMACRMLAL
jgi:hypothetical protein